VMILDEAHNWMNARTWDGDGGDGGKKEAVLRRLKLVAFFSQHRKLGWDVYLITQSPENLDAQVRRLMEFNVTLRNLKRAKYVGWLMPRPFFLAIWRWNQADDLLHKRDWFGFKKAIAGLYDTLALSHGLDAEPDPIWLPLAHVPNGAGGSAPEAPPGHDGNDDQAQEQTAILASLPGSPPASSPAPSPLTAGPGAPQGWATHTPPSMPVVRSARSTPDVPSGPDVVVPHLPISPLNVESPGWHPGSPWTTRGSSRDDQHPAS
jgi:hypothetical protein